MDHRGFTRSVTPLTFLLAVLAISIVAGFLGSLLGLGGGTLIVPALTLLLGVDIRFAIGAAIVAVIATSSGAAAAYVRERMTNLRVAMVLEIATTAGAITGAVISGLIPVQALYVIFGLVLAVSALSMLRHRAEAHVAPVPADRLSDRLALHGQFHDAARGEVVDYRVTRAPLGLGIMYVAGATSGLLGVGGGSFKVPAMDLAMRLPIKVSTATSNFMIGVTAAASAAVYFGRGDINPTVAAPVAAGVLVGAMAGARVLPRVSSSALRAVFVVVLGVVAVQMLRQGFGA